MGKNKTQGWYHLTDYDSSNIEFHSESPRYNNHDGNYFGPFPTYSEAKLDAIAYHTTTKQDALRAIAALKRMKKPIKE